MSMYIDTSVYTDVELNSNSTLYIH